MRSSFVTLVAMAGLLAGGCERRGPGAGEETAPVTGPDVIWVLDKQELLGGRVRTVPDGESLRISLWYGGREEGAPVVVFVMRDRPIPPTPDGDMASGVWFDPEIDCLAYRVSGSERETATGPWREFRRMDGDEKAEAIRAASEERRKKR